MVSYRFLDFELSEENFSLNRGDRRISLEPKALRVLIVLVSRAGRLVDKQDLLASVWPNTFVEENTLTKTIAILRRELGDSRRESMLIETVPTRGYRFTAPVAIVGEVAYACVTVSKERSKPTESPVRLRWRSRKLLIGGLSGVAVGVATAGILLLRHPSGRHTNPVVLPSEKRITSNSPEAPIDFAEVSPDGKYVAYSDPTGLYLRVISTGETHRWSLPTDFIAKPNSWFPDGTHLVVMRREGTLRTHSLWKLSLLGSEARKLAGDAELGSVSPDGTRIAFVRLVPQRGSELWVMGSDGSNPYKIAETSRRADPGHISSAAWSPNSKRIAFIEREGFAGLTPSADLSTLWTRNADGSGDAHAILKDTWLGPAVFWNPDGRLLFATRAESLREGDREEMRSIRVDASTGQAVGQPQAVTTGTGTVGAVSVTSDGKRMVLVRSNSQEQAFISEFNNRTRKMKTPHRLTLDANGNEATAWLADNRTVLFVSNRNGTWTLYKQAIHEAVADVLVAGHSIFLPRLSADGLQMLYRSQADPSNPSTEDSLMRLPVAGGPPRLVMRGVGIGNYQCARLPSRLCLFDKARGDDIVFTSFDPEQGVGHELLRSGGGRRNWALSPDGKELADFPDGRHRLRFFAINDGVATEWKTITLADWLVPFGDWTSDGKGLLVPSFTAGECR